MFVCMAWKIISKRRITLQALQAFDGLYNCKEKLEIVGNIVFVVILTVFQPQCAYKGS